MTFIDASAPIAAHAAIKQNVHGVGANDIADVADISTHAAVSINVHGTGAGNDVASNADISTHAAVTTNIHGTGAGNDVASDNDISTHAAITTNVHGTGAGNDVVGDDELAGFPHITRGSYTGNATTNRAIAHGLGTIPKMILITRANVGYYYSIIASGFFVYVSPTVEENLAVTAADATNFYVGNPTSYSYTGNANTEVMTWVAIG